MVDTQQITPDHAVVSLVLIPSRKSCINKPRRSRLVISAIRNAVPAGNTRNLQNIVRGARRQPCWQAGNGVSYLVVLSVEQFYGALILVMDAHAIVALVVEHWLVLLEGEGKIFGGFDVTGIC